MTGIDNVRANAAARHARRDHRSFWGLAVWAALGVCATVGGVSGAVIVGQLWRRRGGAS